MTQVTHTCVTQRSYLPVGVMFSGTSTEFRMYACACLLCSVFLSAVLVAQITRGRVTACLVIDDKIVNPTWYSFYDMFVYDATCFG